MKLLALRVVHWGGLWICVLCLALFVRLKQFPWAPLGMLAGGVAFIATHDRIVRLKTYRDHNF